MVTSCVRDMLSSVRSSLKNLANLKMSSFSTFPRFAFSTNVDTVVALCPSSSSCVVTWE